MKLSAKATIYGCYLGYITQAIGHCKQSAASAFPHFPQGIRRYPGSNQSSHHHEFLCADSGGFDFAQNY